MNETIDALEKILAVERTAINDSDAWTEIKVTARAALALARAEQAEPTHKESLSVAPTASAKLEPWMVHARKLVQWRHYMSYNDSYFGESPGLLKHITAELERLLPEEPLEAAHNAKLGGRQCLS